MSHPVPRGHGVEESFPGARYSQEETEFLMAVDRYKRRHHRPHPTCTEILDVLRSLGWRRDPPHSPEPERKVDDGD